MKHRPLLLAALILTSLTFLAIGAMDTQVARTAGPSAAWWKTVVNPAIDMIEIAFGFPISKWLTGGAILLASIVLFFFARFRPTAWLLLFVSVSELATRLIAGVLKNVFLRLRPYETTVDRWFTEGGSSFPSGHAAHFWGLFFAMAVAFPKTRIPFLVLALFVSFARVVVNDHYVSDVLASGAIAALVTFGCALICHPERRSTNLGGVGAVQASGLPSTARN